MAFAWEAANRGCPGGFKEGSKAQKSYYLRTKHTIFRKYGPKIAAFMFASGRSGRREIQPPGSGRKAGSVTA